MARRLAWALCSLALVWCGWWWLATAALQRGIADTTTALRTGGWVAEVNGLSRAGFPLRIEAGFDAPRVAPPGSGFALAARQGAVTAPIYWPGDVVLTLPGAALAIGTGAGRIDLRSAEAQVLLDLKPTPSLPFDSFDAVATEVSASTGAGTILTGGTVTARLAEGDGEFSYNFDLSAKGLTPDPKMRSLLGISDPVSQDLGPVLARGSVRFDGPLDRHARGTVQPVALTLDSAELAWGVLSVTARADLTVDARGRLSGPLQLSVTQWRDLLDLLDKAGVLTGDRRATVENVLDAAARGSERLNLSLTLDRGRVALGFIPLGTLPPLVLP